MEPYSLQAVVCHHGAVFLSCCRMRYKHLVIHFGCQHIYGCKLFFPVVNASLCDGRVLCNHALLRKSLTLCNFSRNVDVSINMFTMEGLT